MNHRTTSRRASRTRAARFSLRPVALALACMGAAPAFAQLPTWNNFTVRGGAVTVGTPTANATQLGIAQATPRAIIDWQGFSIGQGNAVTIAQPGAASVLLNRVTGNDLSTIAGSLTANGRVFLVNPNGVLFTGTSSVNVGGLVASTLQMSTSDSDFMAGSERLVFRQDGFGMGSVQNQGSIRTQGSGGTVALVGAQVSNTGSIVAQGGTAALVSADTVTIDFAGDGLTTFRVSPGLYSSVSNGGTVEANGGRVVLMATAGQEVAQGVVNTSGVLRADSLASRNGEIILDSGSSAAGVTITGGTLSAVGGGAGLTGGKIEVSGRSILVQPSASEVSEASRIDASGSAGGGSVRLYATAVGNVPTSGAIAVASGSTINADATGAGNGGDIRVMGERTLRAYGTLSARGGPAGGNGGFIETSGGFAVPAGENNGGIELTGLRIDASAPLGIAGTWLIDPFDVTIVNGAAAGSLPSNPFDPIAVSTVQDGDINAALNAGTSVTITTGTTGPTTGGTVTFGNGLTPAVLIDRTAGGAPVSFQIDANLSINAFDNNTIIRSTGGALNVVFNAGQSGQSGAINYNGQILTNGGNVTMNANSRGSSICAVCLGAQLIDTRVGGVDTGAGGAISLTGTRDPAFGFGPVVQLFGTELRSSTGDVTITGIGGQNGTGVAILSNGQGAGGIFTTSGDIRITGVGSSTAGSTFTTPGHGVEINAVPVQSVDGDITVHGLRLARTNDVAVGNGILVASGAVISTLGTGNIELTGESQIADAGVFIEPAARALAAAQVNGNNNVVLRAASAGAADALAIGGTVRAGNVLDLRPGGVDTLGNASDRTANPITLGGTAANGFAVSADELTRVTAGTIVAGSNLHAGNIDVVGPLSMASPLTLQNGGGGNITLGASVATPQLALLSAGNITQAAGASIVATRLLARSSGGNVLLNDAANNVSVGTVGGGAAGRFEYTDADAVTLGAVAATAFDAASNLPQAVPGTSVTADRIVVRTLSGDLSLGTDVTSTSGTDLVAAARFQNLGAFTIAGAPWRIWADSWTGETRGGLFGSGLLPNLYNCAYLGLCGVTVSAADNHFIYVQRPTATVVIADAMRPGGFPNPPFVFSVTGLILGDTAAGFGGVLGSPATAASPPGVYPIDGSFNSAAGYLVKVVPGRLSVGDFVQLPKPDVLRDLPTTWLYDRNIGAPPICFATGTLEGDPAQQGADVLGREWSRVRSRPKLTSCVDTERRNGCGDF
jgi:filamentous hemagglutinin family protein